MHSVQLYQRSCDFNRAINYKMRFLNAHASCSTILPIIMPQTDARAANHLKGKAKGLKCYSIHLLLFYGREC